MLYLVKLYDYIGIVFSGPIQRKHRYLINKALQPIQAQISPIKPVKDNLNR